MKCEIITGNMPQLWEELLLQFGEDNMRQLVELLTSLNELSCSLGQKDKK